MIILTIFFSYLLVFKIYLKSLLLIIYKKLNNINRLNIKIIIINIAIIFLYLK